MTNLPDRLEIERRLALARNMALQAGDITLQYFQSENLEVERKADDSPVTCADREAEQLLRAKIEEAFPEDGIFGEEFPEIEGSNSFRWVLDPIDGTKSFIHGVPLFTTLIGLLYEESPVLGVIHAPALGEMMYASCGAGTWYVKHGSKPRRTLVRPCLSLSEALFVTSEVKTFQEVDRQDVYDKLESACRLSRSWGDGYGYMMVASGRADIMIDPIVNLWDLVAVMPVIVEAGGTFTDWTGTPTIHGGNGIATAGPLHDDVLRVIM